MLLDMLSPFALPPADLPSHNTLNEIHVAEPVRPFDFLINGELVRLSLEKHLLARDISAVSSSLLPQHPSFSA